MPGLSRARYEGCSLAPAGIPRLHGLHAREVGKSKESMKKLLTGFADEPIVLIGFQEIVTNRNYCESKLEGG